MDYALVAVLSFAAGCYVWNRFVTDKVKSKLISAESALIELGKGVKGLF